MSANPYIGRGEVLFKNILLKLYDCEVKQQVNIQQVIYAEDYNFLDQEVKNHNFDFVMLPTHGKPVVIEVNYQHGEKIAAKLRRILVPLIRKRGYEYLEINNWDCEERGLFWLNSKGEHPVTTWTDIKDVINALETCEINPDL